MKGIQFSFDPTTKRLHLTVEIECDTYEEAFLKAGGIVNFAAGKNPAKEIGRASCRERVSSPV